MCSKLHRLDVYHKSPDSSGLQNELSRLKQNDLAMKMTLGACVRAPPERDQILFFICCDWYWSSLESGDVWYQSRQLKKGAPPGRRCKV